ncbi:MAG: hypothetical protein LBT32_03540 [Peptococcaceae bacterium]|nr:hypothetical protein [Peptococcaceae bacterium]
MKNIKCFDAFPRIKAFFAHNRLLDFLPDGFAVACDSICQTILFDPIAAGFFQLEPWRPYSWLDLSSDPKSKAYFCGRILAWGDSPFQYVVRSGNKVHNQNITVVWKDGHRKTLKYSCSPLMEDNCGEVLGALALLQDITYDLSLAGSYTTETPATLHESISRLDRLNLIGQMAASIGHEIRNPITIVRGYLQLMGGKPLFSAYHSIFKTMIGELDRANSIISEFISIAKELPPQQAHQDLNAILENLYPLIEADAFTKNMRISYQAGCLPNVFIDAKEIAQLILNVCHNGLEAMAMNGKLNIRTYTDGHEVVLCVQDEGGLIPTETLENMGTPFFTTKPDGTGLGLAICHDIANHHNGILEIANDAHGTTINLRLPIPETTICAAQV